MHSDASLPNNNATCTFWRGVEGFSVTPTGGTMQWAVSQAVPFRRMHVRGNIVLHQKGGWASGGWMSDSLVDGNVGAGPQQQWISRNSEWGSWTGANWNMVFVGVPHPPAGEWPSPPYTKVERTPVVREKPFLASGRGRELECPRSCAADRTARALPGTADQLPGRSIPLSQFYIAQSRQRHRSDHQCATGEGQESAADSGHLRPDGADSRHAPDTVVMGLGFATLRPTNGTAAMTTGRCGRHRLSPACCLMLASKVAGAAGGGARRKQRVGTRKNPILLHDVFFRVGGAGVGSAQGQSVRSTSNDTIIDHTWIWRADHGAGVGWDQAT